MFEVLLKLLNKQFAIGNTNIVRFQTFITFYFYVPPFEHFSLFSNQKTSGDSEFEVVTRCIQYVSPRCF